MNDSKCPLCGGGELHGSWLKTSFRGKAFDFLECADCRSLVCDPMPDTETLSQMYDSTYADFWGDSGDDKSLEKFASVLKYLETLEKGTFIDYGCGDGGLLRKVKSLGWDVLGIEFNPDFAKSLAAEGIRVLSYSDEITEKADVLHLGDVVEHLTDLDGQFPQILDLLKDDGCLMSHGPLEGNPNLFYQMLKLGKKFKRDKVTEMPPFHVILATSQGQRALFERFGLKEMEFQVDEVAFPAVDSISLKDLTNIRTTGLFALRKASQITSSRDMPNLGNRYFYVGRKT